MNKAHLHPLEVAETVFGRVLQVGETLQKGDIYDSTTGKWEPIPEGILGSLVREKHAAILIRPARQCTANVPTKHDLATTVITDPDSGMNFIRTSCFSCKRWFSDNPLLA
jgi:hypothetical protein